MVCQDGEVVALNIVTEVLHGPVDCKEFTSEGTVADFKRMGLV